MIKVDPLDKPVRLDKWLADREELDLTRSRIQRLIADGDVTVDGSTPAKNLKVRGGEAIELTVPPPQVTEIIPENITVDILFQDDHLAIVNKPAGMVTHPAVGNRSGTLVNALAHHLGQLAESDAYERPGIVHRLDKETSGLLVVARTVETMASLQEMIQQREVKRTYWALICGHVSEDEGVIELPIGRSLKDRKKMTVTNLRSREASTAYRLLDRFRSYDLLELSLNTGRTHQIRVHMSHIGHPVFGDPEYGGREKWHRGLFAPERPLAKKLLETMDRQALLAKRLDFKHPVTEMDLSFEVDPPEDLQSLLDILDSEGR